MRVDYSVNSHFLACYFQEIRDGEKAWIQFKKERLSNFCYKCDLFYHVIGRCSFYEFTMVKNRQGIAEKLYSPWLRTDCK